MPTTSNFGWTTPADTDLVKDGAAAIRTLGNGIDTSLVDLKGGTTGQVLAKATNTDLDFTWVAQDDSNAIQNAIVDAKGDLITATAADTPARLAVGTNNQVLMADSSTATGLKWGTPSAGGMTSLASGNLPTNTGTLTLNSISGTYRNLMLILKNAYPANNGENLQLRFNSSSTDYFVISYNTANSTTGVFSQTEFTFQQSNSNTGTTGLSIIEIPEYAGGTWKLANYIGISPASSNANNTTFLKNMAVWNKTDAITSLQILASSGNFGGGSYVLYGVS